MLTVENLASIGSIGGRRFQGFTVPSLQRFSVMRQRADLVTLAPRMTCTPTCLDSAWVTLFRYGAPIEPSPDSAASGVSSGGVREPVSAST
jgi:hypothetical protein